MTPETLPPLPTLAEEIAETIGVDGLLLLVDARGGQRLTVPVGPAEDHPLAAIMGRDRWDKFRATFPGETLDIPTLKGNRTALMHAAIRRDRSGATVNELAARYGLTGRQIKRICAAGRRECHGDLFD